MTNSSRATIWIWIACLLALPAGGCNIGMQAMFLVQGPPKDPAAVTLPKDRPTAILLDDPASKLPRREIRNIITKTAEDLLLHEKVITDGKLISSQSIGAAALASEGGKPISVVDAGRRVGAEIVIYAEVAEWSLVANGESVSPAVTLQVRVLDTLKNERIFPAGEATYPVKASLPVSGGNESRSALERALAAKAGLALAQMFYEHERVQLQNQRPTDL